MGKDNGKNVIITGANRGIGLASVHRFAENGWNVWACARKQNAEFGTEMSRSAERFGVWIKPVYFELSDEGEIKRGFTDIYNDKKPVHALINNAGIAYSRLFQMTPMEDIAELFKINVFSVMMLSQLTLKIMAKQKYGNIINIASSFALRPHIGNIGYASSKAAVIAFTQGLAMEVAGYGNIRVNAIAPGPTDTDMLSTASEEYERAMLSHCAMNRKAKPSEIANAAYFLASDDASFINGQVISVDGGESYGNTVHER